MEHVEDGGSSVLGYQIWRDNGFGGDFKSLYDNDSVLAVTYLDTELTNGRTYRYMYRIRNTNGWSEFSPIGYLVAASVPNAPGAPSLTSVDDGQFTLAFNSPTDTGGSRILSYMIEIDEGELNTPLRQVMADSTHASIYYLGTETYFTGSSGTHTFTESTDAAFEVTPGKIYRVRWKVTNLIGTSEGSKALRIGFGEQSSTPSNFRNKVSSSSAGKIVLEWDSVSVVNLPITGYSVQMKTNEFFESYVTVYDGSSSPDITNCLVDNLEEGKYYQFRVYSHNFNGKSAASTVIGAYACGNPSGFSSPRLVSSTAKTITIEWDPPKNDGGCPIEDYAVYRDRDGSQAVWTLLNPTGDSTRNDAYTRLFECDTFAYQDVNNDWQETNTDALALAQAGRKFSFYIVATSTQGTADSTPSGPLLLAGVPATPTNEPTVDASMTDGTQITVEYEMITEDQGSDIISYELQKGSLSLNDFISISGSDSYTQTLSFTVTKDITPGAYYAFRYRAINSVGTSEWSPVGRIQAATTPDAPLPLEFESVTASTGPLFSITLGLTHNQIALSCTSTSSCTGGSPITETKIYTDLGVTANGMTTELLIISDSPDSSTTLNTDKDKVTIAHAAFTSANTKVRFAYAVKNAVGWSELSNPITVETSTVPGALAAPMVDWTSSTKTSLYIYWVETTAPTDYQNVVGYILSMDDGNGGAFTDIFDGRYNPNTKNFVKSGLTTGKEYRFRVRAVGYNEEGPAGIIKSFYVCGSPSGFAAPTVLSQSRDSISIQWKPPSDTGGCPIQEYAVFRSDGTDPDITTEVVNSYDEATAQDIAVRGNPSLSSVVIKDFNPDQSDEGKTFRIKVKVYNIAGREADSTVVSLVLASVPVMTTTGPQNNVVITSSNRIGVSYGVTDPVNNGGTLILSYALEIDDGLNGDFRKTIGYTSNSVATSATITTGIVEGREYRLRYRVKNAVGWSDFSPISFILAADIPGTPLKPTFDRFETSADATPVHTLYITIHPSVSNGGSPITKYVLTEYPGGVEGDSHDIFPSSMQYTISSTDDTLIGSTYNFRVVAVNRVEKNNGKSLSSNEATIAFGDVPPAPAQIDPDD